MLKLFVLEPIEKLRDTIAEVIQCFRKGSHTIYNTDVAKKDDIDIIQQQLRDLSVRLISDHQRMPHYLYPIIRIIFSLPDKTAIKIASGYLAQMSLLIHQKEEEKYYLLGLYQLRICSLLNIPSNVSIETPEENMIDAIREISSGRN